MFSGILKRDSGEYEEIVLRSGKGQGGVGMVCRLEEDFFLRQFDRFSSITVN